jgi:hypothetical protein
LRQPREGAGGGTPFSPDCWNEYNSENGGLTEYEGPPVYPEDSSGDDGISVAEAWGPATLWTLTNHDWSNSIDRKALLIFTDVFPTGADGAENDPIQFKQGSCSQQLCTEMDFVRNITQMAENKGIELYVISGGVEWSIDELDGQYGDPDRLDANDIWDETGERAGGWVTYNNVNNLESEIGGIIRDKIIEPDNSFYEDAGRIVHYGSRNFTGTDRNKFLVTSHDGEYDTVYTSEDWNFSNSNTKRDSVGNILNLGGKEYTIENLQNEGEYQGSSVVLKRPVAEFGAPLTTGSREVINRYVSYDDGENLDLMKVKVTGW